MERCFNHRYKVLRSMSIEEERPVLLCQDRLTQRRGALQLSPYALASHELHVLLELPPGTAPAILDVCWSREGRLGVILEDLPGRSLEAAAAELDPSEIPLLVQRIAQCLMHVHRAGWVHTALTPRNIHLLSGTGVPAIRLLDFGYALGRLDDLEESARGGTPPYVAPEVRRGSVVDGRADLYSLGVVLLRCFPNLVRDSRWTTILSGLTNEAPEHRYPDAAALRDEVSSTFSLAPGEERFPCLGGGPLRNRQDSLLDLVLQAWTESNSCFLVQARPGVGLTRFLIEAVLGLAQRKGPRVRMLDLGNRYADFDSGRALEFLDETLREDHEGVVICGVGDPSPGFHGMPDEWRGWLQRKLEGPAWRRFSLPPLEPESLEEMVATSLGSVGEEVHVFSRWLHELTDGDLAGAAEAFRACVESAGREDGLSWRLDPDLLRKAMDEWRPTPVAARVPPQLMQALRVCGRAGPSVPDRVAKELLGRFGDSGSLAALIDHGYLQFSAGNRVTFADRSLWRELVQVEPAGAAEIDDWLHGTWSPDLGRIDDVLLACARARTRGDGAREAQYLISAMSLAHSTQRGRDLLRLFSYPQAPPLAWTIEGIRDRLAQDAAAAETTPAETTLAVAETAPPETSRVAPERLLLWVAESLQGRDGDLSRTLLEEVAGGPDPESAAAARALLEQGSERVGADAETLRRHLAAARDAELCNRIRQQLARTLHDDGEFEAAAECAEEGIRDPSAPAGNDGTIPLRILRAQAWTCLDRITPAWKEAEALVALPRVQHSASLLRATRLLLAYCHLHRGSRPATLREISRAWAIAGEGVSEKERAETLDLLIDAVLDLEAWEHVPQADLAREVSSEDPDVQASSARARALLAQMENRQEEAAAILEQRRAAVKQMKARAASVRYLHHLGLIRLSDWNGTGNAAAARLAQDSLQEALSFLPAAGLRYLRGRVLLDLSRARRACGDAVGGQASLVQAISLARGIQSFGLLAQCLAGR